MRNWLIWFIAGMVAFVPCFNLSMYLAFGTTWNTADSLFYGVIVLGLASLMLLLEKNACSRMLLSVSASGISGAIVVCLVAPVFVVLAPALLVYAVAPSAVAGLLASLTCKLCTPKGLVSRSQLPNETSASPREEQY